METIKDQKKFKTTLAEHFDEIHQTYDRSRFGDKAQIQRKLIDYEARNILPIALRKGLTLEVGVGTGRYGLFLSKKGYRFVGVDISRSMLNIANRKGKTKELDFALFRGDGENLAFQSVIFDNYICIATIGFLPNVLKALRESLRVLKPNGRVVIAYYSRRTKSRFLRKRVPRIDAFGYTIRYTIGEMKQLLEKVGFKIIYKKEIANFPSFVYHLIPEVIYYKILKHFDDMLSGGFATLIVGEKHKSKR